jgi:hypothetical protein
MFYKPSTSRVVLGQWVAEILDSITPVNEDRATLDAITSAEILDLAYLEGGSLKSAVAAHALFPTYVEQEEAQWGNGTASVMEAIFPIEIDEEDWGFEIYLRAGRPSMLGIGRGAIFPRGAAVGLLPGEMVEPNIGGTRYMLREPNGNRLQTLAGPMIKIERSFEHIVKEPTGKRTMPVNFRDSISTYAYLDQNDNLQSQQLNGELHPLRGVPERIRS